MVSDFYIEVQQAKTLEELLDILKQYSSSITDEPISLSLTSVEEKILDEYYQEGFCPKHSGDDDTS